MDVAVTCIIPPEQTGKGFRAAGCAGGCSALVLLTGNNVQSLLRIVDGMLQHVG